MQTSAASIGAAAPEALWPLPAWLTEHEGDEAYGWALSAWRRAAAQKGAWFDAAKAEAVVSNWPRWFKLTADRFDHLGVPVAKGKGSIAAQAIQVAPASVDVRYAAVPRFSPTGSLTVTPLTSGRWLLQPVG